MRCTRTPACTLSNDGVTAMLASLRSTPHLTDHFTYHAHGSDGHKTNLCRTDQRTTCATPNPSPTNNRFVPDVYTQYLRANNKHPCCRYCCRISCVKGEHPLWTEHTHVCKGRQRTLLLANTVVQSGLCHSMQTNIVHAVTAHRYLKATTTPVTTMKRRW